MIDQLTAIELGILEALARDFLAPIEIAKLRNRGESTIITQLFRIRKKFGARNNLQLVALYWQWRTPGDREYVSWQ